MSPAIDARALLTLTRWLNPAFPTGAFAYSHGLETEVARGVVCDGPGFARWLEAVLCHGAGRNDAILLAESWRADGADARADLAALALALSPGAERHEESAAQGAAFVATLAGSGAMSLETMPLPVAVGAAARAEGLPLEATLLVYLQNWAANLVTIAVRHVPLGQSEGQAILSRLAPRLLEIAREAGSCGLEALGGCAFGTDLASLEHETQRTRIFRS